MAIIISKLAFKGGQIRTKGNKLEEITSAPLPCKNTHWGNGERKTVTEELELAFNKVLRLKKPGRKCLLSNRHTLPADISKPRGSSSTSQRGFYNEQQESR